MPLSPVSKASKLNITDQPILPQVLYAVNDYRMVAYSLLLVLMMIFRPKGLLGTYDFSLSRVLEKLINLPARAGEKKEVGDQ